MRFTKPSLPALRPSEDPLGIKPIQRITVPVLHRRVLVDPRLDTLLLLEKEAQRWGVHQQQGNTVWFNLAVTRQPARTAA
jgi:hypothetical protein